MLFSFIHFRFGDCQVQVTIGDENDNNPTFTNLPNETSVSEGASTNTAFYTVMVRIRTLMVTILGEKKKKNLETSLTVLL